MKKYIKIIFILILIFGISFLIYKMFFSEEKIAIKKESNEEKTTEILKNNENIEKNNNKNNDNSIKNDTNIENNNNNDKTLNNDKLKIKTPENVTEPTYIDGVMIINKKNPLPKNYNKGENKEAREAVNKLIADMQNKGLNVSNQTSGFRSYEYQENLYNNYVATYGKQQADTFSARAGYSEHQSGLAFDLIDNQGQLLGAKGSLQSSIDSANWLAENAHNYGFIVRYKKEFINYTGYNEETWHIRYLGKDLATKVYNKNVSLEQYLDVQGGDYNN